MKKMLFLLFSVAMGCRGLAQTSFPDRNQVMNYFQNQRYEEALRYLQPALLIDSHNVVLLSYAGYASYMNENQATAAKYFQQVVHLDSGNVSALRYLERITSRRQPDTALGYARRVVQSIPENAGAWRDLAALLARTKNTDSALGAFQKAYSLSPADPKTITGFAELQADRKDYAGADSLLTRGLTLDSLDAGLLRLRVRCGYESKNFRAVPGPGEKLIAMGEGSSASLTELALAYYNLGRDSDCIRVCDVMAAEEIAGENVFFYAARSLSRLKAYAPSNEKLKICLSKAISNTAEQYYYSMADNFEHEHQYRKAVACCDTAWYLFKNPVHLYNGGRICETGLHDLRIARKYYRLYLKNAVPQTPDERLAYRFVRDRLARKEDAGK